MACGFADSKIVSHKDYLEGRTFEYTCWFSFSSNKRNVANAYSSTQALQWQRNTLLACARPIVDEYGSGVVDVVIGADQCWAVAPGSVVAGGADGDCLSVGFDAHRAAEAVIVS